MNAAQLLADRGRSVPLHPVVVRLVDPSDPSRVAEAPAVLRFVPERARLDALDRAAESLAKLKQAPGEERRRVEEALHLLVQAVRQEETPSIIFFETVEQARSMLVDDEVFRLKNEYDRYKWTHFPETLTLELAQKIAEDAKTHFFVDLLTSHGYWPILRALPFLAATYGALLTPGSSPTPSATT